MSRRFTIVTCPGEHKAYYLSVIGHAVLRSSSRRVCNASQPPHRSFVHYPNVVFALVLSGRCRRPISEGCYRMPPIVPAISRHKLLRAYTEEARMLL